MFSFLVPLLEVFKVIIASVASVIFISFACLTFAGTAVGFVITTPIFITFSPILVPAGVATVVLATGLAAGGSFISTAIGLIMWLIKRRMGVKPTKNPPPEGLPPNAGAGGAPTVSLPRLMGRGRLLRRLLKARRRFKGGGGLSPIGGGGGKIGELLGGRLKDRLKGLGGGGLSPLSGGGGLSPLSGGGGLSPGGLLSGGGGGKLGELLGKLKDLGGGGLPGSDGGLSSSGSEGGLSGSEGSKPPGSEGGLSGSEASKPPGSGGGLK